MQQEYTPRMKSLGGSRYLVESRTEQGTGHQVDVVSGRCSCPAGKHRRACWHLKVARQMHEWQAAYHRPAPGTGMRALQEAFE